MTLSGNARWNIRWSCQWRTDAPPAAVTRRPAARHCGTAATQKFPARLHAITAGYDNFAATRPEHPQALKENSSKKTGKL